MRIAILGVGKMGSWLAKELSAENEVAVYDIDKGKAERVEKVQVMPSLSELEKFKPELLINSVTLQKTIAAFGQAAPHLPKACVLVDVASIKEGIAEYYRKCGFRFASVHPMFGPTFADLNSLAEENAVIIKESDPEFADFFRKLFSRLGVRIFDYSFKEHDEMMAYSLTTPFVTSLVFASCLDMGVVPGSTFARHRKIAKGLLAEDDWLLCEVLFNKQSLPQLERITSRLEFLKHVIKARDYDEAREVLEKLRKNIG